MNQEARNKGIQAIRRAVHGKDKAIVLKAIAEHPSDWINHLYDDELAKLTPNQRAKGFGAMYNGHFTFGMAIRNLLRNEGCSEKELGVDNLDDYYIEMVEEAMKP